MSDSEDPDEYSVVDQTSEDLEESRARRTRRGAKSKKSVVEQEYETDDDNTNSTNNASRYEEDEDYQEPGKKKRTRGSEKKKSKKKSKHHDSDEEIPVEEAVADEGRSVPPLKIKLPPREKSTRSSKRKSEIDESSMGHDEDEFETNVASTSTRKSKQQPQITEETPTSAPTRRSERIFVSNAKKTDPSPEDEHEEEYRDVIDFKITHKDYCQSCRQGGELILCDYCPRAYHKVCLTEEIDDDKIPDDWCCPHCVKNGKPDPKELREQQAALVAKKKKKQKDLAAKQQLQQAATVTPAPSTSKGKPKEIENRDYCEICNQVGELLLCDTCPRAYHLVCMDQQTVPSGNWSCPYCEEHGVEANFEQVEEKVEKAEKIICKGCRQTGGEIVFCATCPTRYHIHCMNPPLDEVPETWHCLACSVEPLKGKVQRIITWRWKKPPLDAEAEKNLSAEDSTKNLLKNLKNRKPREREFFVKWKDMSYWHCSWVDEGQLQVFHNNMHRFYTQKNDMANPPVFDDVGTITTDVPHEAKPEEIIPEEGGEEQSEYHRGISASIAVKHRRRKRASCLPPEVEENYVRYGIRPEWLLIQRIVNHRKSRGKMYYVIKWRELAYEEVTVEPEPDNCDYEIPEYQKKVEDYWNLRRQVEAETSGEVSDEKSKRKDKDDKRKSKDKKKKAFGAQPKSDPKKKWEVQPEYIPEPLKLHDYQKEGINWLRFSWSTGIDTILADEMGLGKTIQTVVFLYSLYKEGHTRGPFLIAAPLSTIINWERELEDWCPDFYVVNYTGNKDSRIIIRENELSFDADVIRSSAKASRIRKNIPVKFHVLLTSYELINADSALLGSIDWKVLVVDEAHRLKSNQSLFFRTLNQYHVGHKLLLTGTPLQNNLEELFNLLNFLSPERFSDMEGFLNEFSDIAKEEQVKKLHDLLGSHLLRRLKADVLQGMPAKSEFIIRVDLAPVQKKYYKYILTRNFDALNSKGGGKQVSLLNIVMDLKKCCNHPYLFPVAADEAPKTKFGYFEGQPLIKACGKLIVLQKMLRKLKDEGHRVLIFSQMTQMLDVLEDFLDAEGYKFERIDGSITGSLRQEAIDRFNAPGAQQFVFLLSTRAGGLGINLATADTVVIYDSDWNPHNDIQALSRAHRIGQTNKVMIYRFVTRNSVEERITQVAKKKMMLTHLVVRPGLGSKTANTTMSKQELDDILKFGTEELFKEEEGKESDAAIHYDDTAIAGLLDRTKEGIEQKEMWANEYLSSFKVASYSTKDAEEEEEEPEEVVPVKPTRDESADPHYWEKLLGAHYMQYQENISRSLGKGKRVRKQVNYQDSATGQNEFQNPESSESSDFSMPSDVSENDEDFDEKMEGRGNQKTLRKSQKEKMPPLLSAIGPNTEVIGFTPKHRKLFLDLVMRFGLPNLEQSLTDSQFYIRELKSKPEKHLRAYASLFISHLCEPGDPSSNTFEDGVPKEGLNVGQVLTRIGIISLIKRKIFEFQDKHGLTSFKLPKKPVPVVEPTPAVPEKTQENGVSNSNETEPVVKEETKKEESTTDAEKKVEPQAESMEVDEQPTKEVKSEEAAVDNKETEMETDTAKAVVADEESKDSKAESQAITENTTDNDQSQESSTVKSEPDESTAQSKEETNGTVESAIEDTKEEVKEEEEEVTEVKEFEFNIQDGGLTELHTLWYFEEKELKPKHEHEIWNRRHDYWMLSGIVKHGYEQWETIANDEDYAILNEPFKTSIPLRNKFMERRLRLLEQALVFEEQLRRYTHLASLETYVEKPKEEKKEEEENENQPKEEGEEEKDGEAKDKKENGDSKKENGDISNEDKENNDELIINPNIQRAANQLEDLLIDMKSDCARIPQTVQRIPSIANRLQIGPRNLTGNSNVPLAGMPQMMNRMM